MARMPRLVVPGYPHHVTQRGNRRQRTFSAKTHRHYIALVSEDDLVTVKPMLDHIPD